MRGFSKLDYIRTKRGQQNEFTLDKGILVRFEEGGYLNYLRERSIG